MLQSIQIDYSGFYKFYKIYLNHFGALFQNLEHKGIKKRGGDDVMLTSSSSTLQERVHAIFGRDFLPFDYRRLKPIKTFPEPSYKSPRTPLHFLSLPCLDRATRPPESITGDRSATVANPPFRVTPWVPTASFWSPSLYLDHAHHTDTLHDFFAQPFIERELDQIQSPP